MASTTPVREPQPRPVRAIPGTEMGNAPRELRERFAEAFTPRPALYWADMLGSAGLGWTLFIVSASVPFGSPLHLVATVGAIFATLRAALFIHEISHLRARSLAGFETVWNAVVGIPVLIPSLMYVGSHMDHHRRTAFGTEQDPEYAPIAHWSRLRIALFVATVAFVPLLTVVRWGVLGPLGRVCPPVRRFAVEHMSTLVINTDYRRPMPMGRQAVKWQKLETAAALFVWAVVGATVLGWIPLHVLGQWWLVTGGVLVVNQVRTLVAHGYENAGEPVDTEGQLLDSINLHGWSLVTALVAPVGLRYHGLHHYLPSLPYHSLGAVHRQLLAELPENSPYRRTLRHGVAPVLQKLWNKTATAPAN